MNNKRLQRTVRYFLTAVFFLSAFPLLQAYPRASTMADDVLYADLIVYGDITNKDVVFSNDDPEDIIEIGVIRRIKTSFFAINVLEVLKGDASLAGKIIDVPREYDIHGPNIAVGRQIVVLAKDAEYGWRTREVRGGFGKLDKEISGNLVN
jgi:hypothetical protein